MELNGGFDLTGQRFGRLTALHRTERDAKGKRLWVCRCDCGATVKVNTGTLRSGARRSCRCGLKTHGYAGTTTYYIYQGMHQRCTNPKQQSYHSYGGRGIKVCARWQSFENFLADMGERPPGLSLDRINNDGPYSPENCRWADLRVQGNNKRTNVVLTAFGESKTLKEWSRDARCDGLTEAAIRRRLRKGLSVEAAIGTPRNQVSQA